MGRQSVSEVWLSPSESFDRGHPGWADLLALLAALEHRPRAASLLLGTSDAAWVRLGRARGRTLAAVVQRAEDRIRVRLEAADMSALRAARGSLSDDDFARLGLARTDIGVPGV